MPVLITDDDYADMAIHIAARHGADVGKQAFFDAFLSATNALNAKIIERTNTELGTAYASLDDAIYGLAAAGFRATFLDHYDQQLNAINALCGTGAGNWAQAIAAMGDYRAALVVDDAAASAAAVATAKTNLIAAVVAYTGNAYMGEEPSLTTLIADLKTKILADAEVADGDALAIAKVDAEYTAHKVATYDPVIAEIVLKGAGLDGFAHVENVSLAFGETLISITPADLKTDYVANANAKVNALNTMLDAILVTINLPTSAIGVTQLFY